MLQPPTIIVSDSSLNLLLAGQGCFMRVGNHIDERNSIKTDHFLEVDKSCIITIDIFYGQTIIRSV